MAAFFAFYTNRLIALISLLGLALGASGGQRALDPSINLAQNQGFCSPGAFEPIERAPGQPPELKAWGSFCQEGDKVTGFAATSSFKAPSRFGIYLAGYVSNAGLNLEIENLAKHSRLGINPSSAAGEMWLLYEVRLPDSWRGNPVRLIAKDTATEMRGWFAFTEPVTSIRIALGARAAIQLLLRTLLSFTLIILPCLALGAFAIRRGLCDTVLVGLVEMTAIGASGYFAFWLWFVAPRLGYVFSLLLPIATGIWFAWNYRRLDIPGRRIINHLLPPLASVGAATLLVVSAGFVYGGLERPSRTAAQRFSHPLPQDNTTPYKFAEALRNGHVPRIEAGWHSSDRPPLQAGVVLSQDTLLTHPRELAAGVLGVVLQSLWIFAAWLFLTAFDVDKRAISLVLLICLLSGFVFLNSFYVWPKLLAAAYTLASLAILVTPKYVWLRNSRMASVLVGAMLAFAMLSHGGSAFAIIGAALTMLVLRRRVPIRRIVLMLSVAAILYTPWVLYQRFVDPPGNRLLKMHLAGVQDVDPRHFGEALADAYGSLTSKQIISNKMANVGRVFEKGGDLWIEVKDLLLHIREQDSPAWIAWAVRGWMFHGLVANLGFLVIGPIVLSAGICNRYRTCEWRAAAVMWMFAVLTTGVWCVLMFGPGTAVIHQGSYAVVLLTYAGSVLAIWTVSRFLAVLTGCLQISLNALLYVVFMHPPTPQALLAEPPPLLGILILCAASAICIFWLLGNMAEFHPAASLARRRINAIPQQTRAFQSL